MVYKNKRLQKLFKEGFTIFEIIELMEVLKLEAKKNV